MVLLLHGFKIISHIVMSSLLSFYYFQDFISFELNTQLVEWCEAIKGEGNLAEFIDCSKMAKGVNIVSFKAFLHH